MPQTYVGGMVGMDNLLSASKIVQMRADLVMRDANRHQLVVLAGVYANGIKYAKDTTNLKGKKLDFKSVPVGGDEYKWLSQENYPRLVRINLAAGYTSAAVTLTIDTSAFIAVATNTHAILQNTRTGERMICTATPSATSITVTRGALGTIAQAILDNDELYLQSYVGTDGTATPAGRDLQQTEQYNYIHIFERSVEFSWGNEASQVYAMQSRDRQRMLMANAFLEDIESEFIFGRRAALATNRKSSGGLDEFITSHILDLGAMNGMLTEGDAKAFLTDLFASGGSDKRAIVCSPRMAQAYADFLEDRMRFSPSDVKGGATAGFWLNKYQTEWGELSIIPHKLLYGSQLERTAFIIDPEYIRLRHMEFNGKNLKPALYNVSTPDLKGTKEAWIGYVGFEIVNESVMGKIVNFAG